MTGTRRDLRLGAALPYTAPANRDIPCPHRTLSNFALRISIGCGDWLAC